MLGDDDSKVMDGPHEPGWPELLERACEDELAVAFQPIVDLARGVACGYEGLARLPADAGDTASWLTAASQHGYRVRLESAMLARILSRRPELPANSFLSVNLSPGALLSEAVSDLLRAEGDLAGLVIEVTEQAKVEDYSDVERVVHGLRARGAMIAVDEVGAGYASLRHLIAMRPQFVKLHRVLVAHVDLDSHLAAAVAAIGALAGELDAWLVADGVERAPELVRLRELGVPLAQGPLLGRPQELMRGLPDDSRALVRMLRRNERDRLSGLGRPALTVRARPDIVAEITVVIDAKGRPTEVIVPAGGRRADRHPPMCVQKQDAVRDVALRAVARPRGCESRTLHVQHIVAEGWLGRPRWTSAAAVDGENLFQQQIGAPVIEDQSVKAQMHAPIPGRHARDPDLE